MRIEAEVPRVTVGGGYQSQQNVNIGYQSKQSNNYEQSTFVTPAATIKRVDSVPRQIGIVSQAVISKPAYREEQIIVKSESATHHQLNDAQIQSSNGASSKFNNVHVVREASPVFVQ